MSTSVNFTSLLNDLAVYLERGQSSTTDPTVFAQLPRLINATERKIAQYLKLLGQIEPLVDPVGLQANNPVITKPDRWRSTVSMSFGTGATQNSRKPLFPRSYEYCRAYWPDDSLTDEPKFYADYDLTHFLIVPTPAVTAPLEAIFYMQPQLLDVSNQTNFFTNYTPNCLLYGSLLEATPFLKDDPRIPVWQGMWDRDLQTLQLQDMQRILDRTQQRRSV